jgi:CRISPR/Cas system-associated exonuclease Cas4 (RecB family)
MMTATRAVRLDEDHRYWVGSLNVPGYSEILDSMGFPKNPFWTEAGRAEGEALHQWLLFLAQGNEPASEPDARIAGRVAGIQKFFAEHAFEFVGGESPLYSPVGYCCTPDLWGRLEGAPVVIEAKRGSKMKRHALQTAAQARALEDSGFTVRLPLRPLPQRRRTTTLRRSTDDMDDDFRLLAVHRFSAYNARGIYK